VGLRVNYDSKRSHHFQGSSFIPFKRPSPLESPVIWNRQCAECREQALLGTR
jgi:hypothetical protein